MSTAKKADVQAHAPRKTGKPGYGGIAFRAVAAAAKAQKHAAPQPQRAKRLPGFLAKENFGE